LLHQKHRNKLCGIIDLVNNYWDRCNRQCETLEQFAALMAVDGKYVQMEVKQTTFNIM